VVTLSETLFQDLALAKAKIGVTVLCPAFVNTGIATANRNRPEGLRNETPVTASQKMADAAMGKAVASGRVTAAEVAEKTFECVREGRFYCLTHPNILGSVELRMRDVLGASNPRDPFSLKPGVAPG
jgi:short-subunit dehydrogenase